MTSPSHGFMVETSLQSHGTAAASDLQQPPMAACTFQQSRTSFSSLPWLPVRSSSSSASSSRSLPWLLASSSNPPWLPMPYNHLQ
ncbi:unnamed protein product [Prunus armeniaca]